MNKNEKFVITINREVRSGGRTVGRKLASMEHRIKRIMNRRNVTLEEAGQHRAVGAPRRTR